MPTIPSPEKWQPDNQILPPQMIKFVVHSDPLIPKQLKGIKTSDKGITKLLVPVKYQKDLVTRTHLELLHQGPTAIFHQLSRNYYWPNMRDTISEVYDACEHCNKARVRRNHLVSEFQQKSLQDLAAPR